MTAAEPLRKAKAEAAIRPYLIGSKKDNRSLSCS
jgi:hypothetical protein